MKKTPSPATRKKRSTQSSKHHKTQDDALEDATDKLNVLFSAPNRVPKPARGKTYTLNVLQKIAGMMQYAQLTWLEARANSGCSETEAGKAFAAELEGMEKDSYAGDDDEDSSVVEHTTELDAGDEETRSEGVADTGEAGMNAEAPRAEVRALKVKVAGLEHKLEHLMDALRGAGIYVEMTSD